jgi:hypothetical protein
MIEYVMLNMLHLYAQTGMQNEAAAVRCGSAAYRWLSCKRAGVQQCLKREGVGAAVTCMSYDGPYRLLE